MAKIIINKEQFKDLDNGLHTLRVNFTDGYSEGQFAVDDKITFYIHQELQIPFTATKGMTWAEWIKSYGVGASGNNILWVGFDNNTLYIDPRGDEFIGTPYKNEDLGSSSLLFLNSDTLEQEFLSNIIIPEGIYGCGVCCFDAGTSILMADGSYKNIENIVKNDKIISYNEATQTFEEDTVLTTMIKKNSDDLVYINLSNGVQLGMRAYHPLLTTNGWKTLRPELTTSIQENMPLLNIGDTIIGINDNPTVESIVYRDFISNYNTYNFSVEKNKNYIANGIVAHNASCIA